MEQNLDITNPQYDKQISPVPTSLNRDSTVCSKVEINYANQKKLLFPLANKKYINTYN